MGSGRVTEVIEALKTGGFRAAAAWPGEKIPQWGDVAVTVCLKKQEADVQVLPTSDRWFGVTYHEDVPAVKESFRKLTQDGVYPARLWG